MSFDFTEIVVLIIGITTALVIKNNRHNIRFIPAVGIFIGAFYLLLTGWLFSVLEGIFWPTLLNLLEHTFYALSSLSLAIWCYKTCIKNPAGHDKLNNPNR